MSRGVRVRVAPSAYSRSDVRYSHNGREGRVVNVARGIATIQYDGDPVGLGHSHLLTNLERAYAHDVHG